MEIYNDKTEAPKALHKLLPNKNYPAGMERVGDFMLYYTEYKYPDATIIDVYLAPNILESWDLRLLFTERLSGKIRRVSIKSDRDKDNFRRWWQKTVARIKHKKQLPTKVRRTMEAIVPVHERLQIMQLAYTHATMALGIDESIIKIHTPNRDQFNLSVYDDITFTFKYDTKKAGFRVIRVALQYAQVMKDDHRDYTPIVKLLGEIADDFTVSHLEFGRYLYSGKGSIKITLEVEAHPLAMSDLLGKLKQKKLVKRILVRYMEELNK